MKKTTFGRVQAHKEPIRNRIATWHIPAWLLCLALAMTIWLAVSNLNMSSDQVDGATETEATGETV